ncbi:hypothetical protein RB628_36995 [Streptomyces sp. ADMS]|uniref:hypothetical protein n=1 Tax=Streptomyces sp. ADMS TaxID=3071415 RepID=UPI00296F4426|nr:hypothetical protein [Streptomyces sp. ADMS]MDW4910773.1 hypothetical protein [Streptomyces sp. ADMS]
MTVVLDDQWGGCAASDTLARLLFRARALAAKERSAEVLGGHLLRAVGEAAAGPAPSVLRDALETVGFSYDALPPRALPAPTGPLPDPPMPDIATRALLATLVTWAGLTGDTRVTSLHLLAALVEDCPEAAELRESGLTADVVLRAAARHRYRTSDSDEDTPFAPARPTQSDLFTVERPPAIEELKRRTPKFLPRKLTRASDHVMPEFMKRLNTPRGVRQLRWIALLQPPAEIARLATIFALIVQGFGPGPWWLLFFPFLVWWPANQLPPPYWLIVKGIPVLLVPGPLRYAVCCAVLLDLLQTHSQLLMKRVDLTEPGLSLSGLAGRFWRAQFERVLGDTEMVNR